MLPGQWGAMDGLRPGIDGFRCRFWKDHFGCGEKRMEGLPPTPGG